MADASDKLVAAIADGVVLLVAAGGETLTDAVVQNGTLLRRDEAMLWVMTMVVLGKAGLAQIKVIACRAMDEFSLR